MFSIYGHEEIIRNFYRLAYPFLGGREIRTSADLRVGYLDFLAGHQPYMPINRSDDVFITDPAIEKALVGAYGHKASLNDLGQSEIIDEPYPDAIKREKIARARHALDEFLNLDDTLAAIFDLTIHSIVVRPSKRLQGRASYGGSSSAAIGTIWLTVGSTLTTSDLVEMLLHELTHHLLFIDERNYPHFDYELITREENRAFSAILNMIRPLDKVMHSIVVATELILGRLRFLPDDKPRIVHPPTNKMIADAMTAYESITSLDAADLVLRPRTREILDRCFAACQSAVLQVTYNEPRRIGNVDTIS
ncbi:MAG TPA: HEXXH motif-containing putative peptide modification protein [Thermoanaerobaculia bacterium]